MELFDYLKYRWKALVVLFVIGVAAIAYLGHTSQSNVYHARTQLLLRPPVGQSNNSYNSDPELYINTQKVLMFTPAYLEAEVAGTSVSTQQLKDRLTFNSTNGSEFVVLQVDDTDPERAVSLVNAVATNYLAYAQNQDAQPAAQESALLTRQITASRKALKNANATIEAATAEYRAENPDAKSDPNPTSVAPRAAATQSLQSQRLQQLLQQQQELQVDQAQLVERSSVLRPATSASLTPGWGHTTYLAALAGLVLVLLTLAGIGLALSSRLLSPSRWTLATDGGHLANAIRLRRGSARNRLVTTRRVSTALAAVGEADSPVLVTYLPGKSKALERKTAFLLQSLEAAGTPVKEVDSVVDARPISVPAGAEGAHLAATPPRVLLLIELAQARLDDVSVLSSYPAQSQRSWVPVLV